MQKVPTIWASVLALAIVCCACNSHRSQTQIADLPNGIKLVSVYFPGSTNTSVFTFTPMGLADDCPGQAQWAHLVEHLVLRTTVTEDLTHANAETLADHMRLDTYGSVADWKTWLVHHRRWIEGVPFRQASLETEKPRVISECDFTAKNFATHKFALAAWAEGTRHGVRRIGLKADVLNAKLSDVQALRDEHFAVPGKVTVCVVGVIEPATALTVLRSELGKLELRGKPIATVKRSSGDADLTWDLDARHLLLTWQIPGFDDADYAALMVAAQLSNMQFASSPELQQQAGILLAGADLLTPEGNFFYVSAALKPGTSLQQLRERFQTSLDGLATGKGLELATPIGQQLAFGLRQVTDPRQAMGSLPPGMTPGMLEANLGLRFGLNVHRYGPERERLATSLSAVSPASVQAAVREYLSRHSCSVCTIQPGRE